MIQTTPVHIVSALARLNVAELLVEYGADCEEWDRCQETQLGIASEFGQFGIARLCSNPARIQILNMARVGLHCTEQYQVGHLQIVRLLVESGAEIDTWRDNNETAFTELMWRLAMESPRWQDPWREETQKNWIFEMPWR